MPSAAQMLRRTGRPLQAVALAAVAAGVLAGCGTPALPPLSESAIVKGVANPVPGMTAAERQQDTEANTLLPGDGKDAEAQLKQRLASLKGTPVVINLWADWCTPCKRELPVFQRVALAERGKVAFLGVATEGTTRGHTTDYLSKITLPYPTIFDGPSQIDRKTGVGSIPKTIIYSRSQSKAPYIHNGPYESVKDLKADIARYSS